MPDPRLLVVEDDTELRSLLRRGLGEAGFDVRTTGNGTEAVAAAAEGPIDAIVMDIGLPDADGRDVVQALRARGVGTPVLFLTARDALEDRISGLTAGADDYVTKPFALAELMARVRAQVRRSQPEVLRAAGVSVDPAARRAWAGDEELDLTPKEFELLELLVRNAGQVVVRDRIMDEVWDENWFGSTKTLDMHVSSLRRKLGDDAAAPTRIVTVRGVGLRFEA
jgi:DNA-binding response OmpR family regulator